MVKEQYNLWCDRAVLDADLVDELKSIKGNDEAISDAFYKDLEFGTGGLRGVIGAGTNRMNVYTVGKATQGLAAYVNSVTSNGVCKTSQCIIFAIWQSPPPTPFLILLLLITKPSKYPFLFVALPTKFQNENSSPGFIMIPSIFLLASCKFTILFFCNPHIYSMQFS